MQTLVVAEKPSVARDIARVLGAKDRGENCLMGGGYVVTWALGHLVTLKEPQELDERYTRWRAEDLPILPEKMETKVIKKTRSQFLSVKKWMNLPNRSLSYTKQKKRRSKEHLFCVSTDLSYRTVASRVLSA